MTNEEANNGLIELIKKIDSSLLPAIDEHVNSDKFNAKKDGLDFLHVKNSLLLTYLIELVLYKKAKKWGGGRRVQPIDRVKDRPRKSSTAGEEDAIPAGKAFVGKHR